MSILIVVVVLVTVAVILYLLLHWHKQKQNRRRVHQLLYRFSQLGSKNNLVFSSQELLKESIIGVDGLHRKLLILETSDGECNNFVIDLSEVSTCRVKTLYKVFHINPIHRNAKQHVEKIVLLFEGQHEATPLEVSFYRDKKNSVRQLPELEQKARDWEVMLSKMLQGPSEKKHMG